VSQPAIASSCSERGRSLAAIPIRVWLPTALLIAVAVSQIALARLADLSPWKGGGFGMFATTDGTAYRFIRLVVDGPGRSEELSVPASLDEAAMRAQLFPADHFLRTLAQAIADREQRHGRPVSSVRVEAWRIVFDGVPLRGTEQRLRAFTLHISPPHQPHD